MKFNISSPSTGTQKTIEIEDDNKVRSTHDKRIGQEIDGKNLGDQFKGYTFVITGGSDKQGFPMKQGVLLNTRVSLLLERGSVGFQAWRGRKGERRRKTVRGCITGPDLSVLNLKITKKGPEHIEGLTDHEIPRRLGPKRASKIRKLFNLSKTDDVRQFVFRHKVAARKAEGEKKGRKLRSKLPKIQRLVTPAVLKRRKQKRGMLKARWDKAREEREHYQQRLDRIKTFGWQRRLCKKRRQETASALVATGTSKAPKSSIQK